MPVLETRSISNDMVVFDSAQCTAAGKALHERYAAAEPFPHIVLDDFIDPDLLRSLLAEWPSSGEEKTFDRDQERLKLAWRPIHLTTPRLRNFLTEMTSEPILHFLEELTGIKKLITDPYFSGGGLHEMRRGGHLGVHADFNIQARLNVLRRINLLIYLNDDWQPEWNGNLELWTRDMSRCAGSASPAMARAVIFNTDLDSFHGVPDPIACPPDRARRSIALYYYTAPTAGLETVPVRDTVFKRRPGSGDRTDWQVIRQHKMADWLPPALYRHSAIDWMPPALYRRLRANKA
jgi:hypothetical protein